MSLRVWLPLDGDLHNQGCSNANIKNNNSTINTNGKIGSCYEFNGTNSYLYFENMDPGGWPEMSVTFWFYSDGTANYFFLLRKGDQHVFRINGTGFAFRDTQNTSTLRQINWTSTLPINIWTHIACVYNRGKVYLYQNGILDTANTSYYHATGTISTNTFNSMRIGRIQSTSSNTYYKGLINDFRIYDHALSAAEIKEISQGLVLHYKLDTLDIQSGTNLVTGVTAGGRTTVLTDGRIGVQTTGVNQDTYFTINLSENIVAGTSYLLTCDASGISNGQYWGFPLGAQSNSGVLPFKIYNGHNVYPFTANSTKSDGTAMDWGTKRLFMDDNQRGDWANQACFYNFQLIKIGSNGTIIKAEDSSGYNHNGTVTGNISLNSNTSRYSESFLFNGTDSVISAPSVSTIKAYSFWLKLPDLTVGKCVFADTLSHLAFALSTSNHITVCTYTQSIYHQTYLLNNLVANEWQHFVVQWNADSSNVELYVNGAHANINSGSQNMYQQDATATLTIGARKLNGVFNNFISGSIADFRAYVTRLSEADILALYHTSAKIDNQQNFHTYELVENQSAIKITKHGQAKLNELNEATTTKFYKTNKNIDTKQIIEF